jgi:hypothetical protein
MLLSPLPGFHLNNWHQGFGSDTKFDIIVRRKELLLRKGIIVYIGAASQFTGKRI